jgi:hypothetical protein
VSVCGNLNLPGETYVLTDNISTTDLACFRIQADRITLDLREFTITGPGASVTGSVGIWEDGAARLNTVVKNGKVEHFNFGIFLKSSTRSTVRAITASDNQVGIAIGDNSLVKTCTVQRNSHVGIDAGNRVQVEDCYIGGTQNGGDANGGGLAGGQRMLVTKNNVKGNTTYGIFVGAFSTVTNNTSEENGTDGIAVGLRSLVTGNTADNNGQDGIEAVCPSTITFNTASGNGLNYHLIDIGQGACFFQHNVDGPDPV